MYITIGNEDKKQRRMLANPAAIIEQFDLKDPINL